MSSGNYKLGPNCRALCILCATVSIGLFSEYLYEVKRADLRRVGDDLDTGTDVVSEDYKERPFTYKEFNINIDDQLLNETRAKLLERSSAKIPREIADYWRNGYDFQQRLSNFNKHPNYLMTIRGKRVHFLHIAPQNTKSSVIIFLHGFPGSFRDFHALIPHLSENHTLVIPSLSGCVYSQPIKAGRLAQAHILHELMLRLGYAKYYVYGNDFGGLLGGEMALAFPGNVMGLYTPFCLSTRRISWFKYLVEGFLPDWLMVEESKSKYSLGRSAELMWNAEFVKLYMIKPETLGFDLHESPIAIANYFVKIIESITNFGEDNQHKKNLTEIYDLDHLIDTFMLYWITKSTPTAINTLNEIVNDYKLSYQIPIKAVPVACPKFLNGLFYQSEWILKDKFNYIVNSNVFSAAHFQFFVKDPRFMKMYAEDIKTSIEEMANVKRL